MDEIFEDNMPLVSVVMATFDEPENWISQAIESMLKQTYDNIELIIADDSKRPETIGVIDKAAQADNRVKVIRKPQRMGFVNALNEGLKMAKGEYIARMDADDVSIVDRIEKQVDFLQSNPQVDVLGARIFIIDGNGKRISSRNYPICDPKLKYWSILRSPIAHSAVIFRRKIVDDGFFYDPSMLKAEDVEFWMRLKKNGYQFHNLPEMVLNYRVVGDLSQKRNREQWRFNYKARLKNFDRNNLIFSIGSVLVSAIYRIMPKTIVDSFYTQENSQPIS